MNPAQKQPLPAGPLSLRSTHLAPAKSLPLALEGRPRELFGRPVNYVTKEVVKIGDWAHRGTGEPYSIPPERLEEWTRNTKALLAAGVRPYLPNRHRSDVDNRDEAKEQESITQQKNYGRVIDVRREGDSWYADLMLVGEEALDAVAANDVSVCIVDGMLDAKGNRYGEALEHLAIVPNPSQSNLGPFMRIAAAAGGAAREVPEFTLSAEQQKEHPMFKPETLKNLRAKLKLPDTTPEADVAEQAAALALKDPPADKTAEVTALSADVAKLTKERDDAKAESQRVQLQLSANAPKEPDALTLSLTCDAFATKREQAIASGTISEAGMKAIDALLMPGGKPNGVALALSGDGTSARPLYARLCEIIAANPGIKTGNAVSRGTKADPRPLALSGDGAEDQEAMKAEAKAEVKRWQDDQLRARGYSVA